MIPDPRDAKPGVHVNTEGHAAPIDPRAVHAEMLRVRDRTAQFAPRLVGMSEGEGRALAQAAGCSIRVVRRDRAAFPRTADFAPARITVCIEGGVIVEAEGG